METQGHADLGLRFDNRPISASEHARLFQTAGWYVLPAEVYERALAGTYYSVAARLDDGRLVGYGRLGSDGGMYAWVHDLIVMPEYRGKGLGGRILSMLVDRVRQAGIPYICLFAAHGVAGFYEKLGFRPRPADAPGMYLWFAPD